jgi:hypothetical protein
MYVLCVMGPKAFRPAVDDRVVFFHSLLRFWVGTPQAFPFTLMCLKDMFVFLLLLLWDHPFNYCLKQHSIKECLPFFHFDFAVRAALLLKNIYRFSSF